jgi:hypothetical protein
MEQWRAATLSNPQRVWRLQFIYNLLIDRSTTEIKCSFGKDTLFNHPVNHSIRPDSEG